MKCLYCKGENPPGRTICISCGGPLDPDIKASEVTDKVTDTKDVSDNDFRDVPHKIPKHVPTYLIPAFLLAICYIIFCGFFAIPFLIVAIVYGFKVIFHFQNEQYEDAKRASRLAKIWCLVSFGVWIIIGGIFLMIAAIQAYYDGL